MNTVWYSSLKDFLITKKLVRETAPFALEYSVATFTIPLMDSTASTRNVFSLFGYIL